MNLAGKKRWLSFMLLFALVLVNQSQSFAMGETAPGRDVNLKVMTYNIHAGAGADNQYDLNRIAQTIKSSGADVIGLEEVDVHWGSRSQFDNEIELLAHKLDMFYSFAPIYSFDPLAPGDPRREYGVALLSKYPIIKANNREITRLSTQEANPVPKPAPGFLETVLNVNGSKVWFYVTHLDYRADPAVRKMQVADMLAITRQHEYSILTGDMNAGPDASELQPLFEKYNDAWALTNDGSGFSYPAESPVKRIDFILAAKQMKVTSSRVINSLASDHLPVTADIQLIRGNQQ
jgi:endonuclease/exonuclease/phosphatase family metal-dependent hydrolase